MFLRRGESCWGVEGVGIVYTLSRDMYLMNLSVHLNTAGLLFKPVGSVRVGKNRGGGGGGGVWDVEEIDGRGIRRIPLC